jgi:hypothetical protein
MSTEALKSTPEQELRGLRATVAHLEADFKFLERNPDLVSYSHTRGWRITFGPKDHSNSFASIRDCIASARKQRLGKKAAKGGR